MNDHALLELTLVFLLAAVVAVPLFRRFGLSAVLGYLVAGVAIGPHGLRIVSEVSATLAASEFGVVMLLFIIGLELSPSRLWVMRKQVFGIGSAQVLASGLLLVPCLLLAFPLDLRGAAVIAVGLALSSTAIGLQVLSERKELAAAHGRIAFAVLLFQDILAIPLLAIIPLLGAAKAQNAELDLAAIATALAAISAVVLGGRYLLRYLFRVVAHAHSVEVFSAATLLVVAGTAWLMQQAGLSMGLGAFLAGVLLADSEFRHELESHIEPFKGLLLGLFFIAVGMSVDLSLIRREPLLLGGATLALLVLKGIALLAAGALAHLDRRGMVLLIGTLAMGGEFGFVVFAESFRAGLIDAALRDRLVVIVGLSMALSPLLLLALGRSLPKHPAQPKRPFDEIDQEHPRVIIAGFGRMGQIVARLLTAQKIPFTALENSPEQVDLSRRFGSKIYFGDPARPELLRAAHADRAEVFVLTTDDPDANLRAARLVKRQYPHLRLFARARNRQHALKLMDLGVDSVIRETYFSALEMSREVLEALGVDPAQARDRTARFRAHDEALLNAQHLVYDDETAMIASSQESWRDLARLFEADAHPPAKEVGAAVRNSAIHDPESRE